MRMMKRRHATQLCSTTTTSPWLLLSSIVLLFGNVPTTKAAWTMLLATKQLQQHCYRRIMPSRSSSSLYAARRRRRNDDDDYYYANENEKDDDDDDYYVNKNGRKEESSSFWKDQPDDEERYYQQRPTNVKDSDPYERQGGFYKVHFDNNNNDDDTTTTSSSSLLEWELCPDASTWVLFPPPHVTTPRSIIHFVGGTFFGSTPKLWYRRLLESVSLNTSSVIVATSIPVITPLSSNNNNNNPLQHVALSRSLQQNFQGALEDVVMDEYRDCSSIPIVGMGHSLGARLLTVLATLDTVEENDKGVSNTRRRRRSSRNAIPYAAYILMSFTNVGASASIPGMQLLLRQSRKLEEEQQRLQDDALPRRGKQSQRQGSRRQRYYVDDDDDDLYDDDEDFDQEWEDLMSDVQDAFREQTQRIRNVLTPRSEELEFYPTPDQLWKALKDDKRYRVPYTLIVQFDEDEIDQSPRLTDCLLQNESLDLKYARLRGVHLTPISVEQEDASGRDWLVSSKEASQALWKLVRGRQSREKGDALRDLRQSIVRYIMDVATNNSKAEE